MPMLGKKPAFDALGAMTGQDTPTPALSWQDRAKIFLAALNGDYAGAEKLKQEPLVQAQQRAFLAQLSGAMKGAPAQYQDGAAPSITPPALPPANGMEDTGGAMAAAQKALAPGPPAQAPPAYQYQPPQMTAPAKPGLNINSPELASLALRGQLVGVPLTNMLEVMKAQQPDVRYDRGFGYNQKTGGPMGAFHPDLDKGQTLGPDGAVTNLPGAVQSAAEMAGAVTGAQEHGKAAMDVISINMPDGSTQQVPRDVAVQAILQSMMPGAKGGLGHSQTPAEKVTSEGLAKTGVERTAAQPQAFAGLVDQSRATDMVLDSLNRVLGEKWDPATGKYVKAGSPMADGSSTGFMANIGGISGTAAHELKLALDPIRANIGFDALAKMRAQSPTGGALGAVSEQENRMLQSTLGSLDPSAVNFISNARRIRDQLTTLRDQRKRLYDSQYGGTAQQPNASTGPRTTGFRSRIVSVQ